MLVVTPGLESLTKDQLIYRFGVLNAHARRLQSEGKRESLDDMRESAEIIGKLGMTPREIIEADYAIVFGNGINDIGAA